MVFVGMISFPVNSLVRAAMINALNYRSATSPTGALCANPFWADLKNCSRIDDRSVASEWSAVWSFASATENCHAVISAGGEFAFRCGPADKELAKTVNS
jgi:hypothetical protein